jgi:hypothetical protein
LNTLGSAVPGRERIVSVEEVYELRIQHPDWVAMQTRQSGLEGTGEIKLRHLVKEALRMRPSRIVVGEVRAEECLDLLLALNSGLPGMATVHANSAREALVKLCTLPLLAGETHSRRSRRGRAHDRCWFKSASQALSGSSRGAGHAPAGQPGLCPEPGSAGGTATAPIASIRVRFRAPTMEPETHLAGSITHPV